MITIQYLEPSPDVQTLTKAEVTARLRAAFDRLPIDIVIIGWDLPPELVDACAQETQRVNAQLYLWHPLLTGSHAMKPRAIWQVSGLINEPVPGHHDLPEFTFLCPNRPSVKEAVLERLRQATGVAGDSGALVIHVEEGSPAARAGVLLGDVIVAIAGEPVSEPGDVAGLLGSERVGQDVPVRVIRGGRAHDISVAVAERPARRGR